MTISIENIVAEYATNKAEIDRLNARNTELTQAMLEHATFKADSETGHLQAAGYKVSITKRLNEKWDQLKLVPLQRNLGPTFADIFRAKYEPDRRALRAYYSGSASDDHKRLLRDACSVSPGKPAVKLEKIESQQ